MNNDDDDDDDDFGPPLVYILRLMLLCLRRASDNTENNNVSSATNSKWTNKFEADKIHRLYTEFFFFSLLLLQDIHIHVQISVFDFM